MPRQDTIPGCDGAAADDDGTLRGVGLKRTCRLWQDFFANNRKDSEMHTPKRRALVLLAVALLASCARRPDPPAAQPGATTIVAAATAADPTLAPPPATAQAPTAAPTTPAPTAAPQATFVPTTRPSSSPLVGPEWTIFQSGDFDHNGVEDVVAYKAAPLTASEPPPGSRFGHAFVSASELAVVERAADGAPRIRLHVDTGVVRADDVAIGQLTNAGDSPIGLSVEIRIPDRAFDLRLFGASGVPGAALLSVRYQDDLGAYSASAADAQPQALAISDLTISPAQPAPQGGMQLPAGANATLSVAVQGAVVVTFFADGLGQPGNAIGEARAFPDGRAAVAWSVPAGVGQLSLYAQARDANGAVATSDPVPLIVIPGSQP